MVRRWLDGICGTLLVGFGVRLALERQESAGTGKHRGEVKGAAPNETVEKLSLEERRSPGQSVFRCIRSERWVVLFQ